MLFYVIFIFNACNTVSTVYPRLSSCRLSAAPYSCSATTVEMVDRLLPLQQSRLLLAAALAAFAEQAKSATVCRWISEEVFWGATWLHHRRLCFSAFDIDWLTALFYTQLASTRSYAIRTHVKYMFNFFIIRLRHQYTCLYMYFCFFGGPFVATMNKPLGEVFSPVLYILYWNRGFAWGDKLKSILSRRPCMESPCCIPINSTHFVCSAEGNCSCPGNVFKKSGLKFPRRSGKSGSGSASCLGNGPQYTS